MVIEEINKTKTILDSTELKCMEFQSDIVEMIWGLEDTKATWDNQIKRIN